MDKRSVQHKDVGRKDMGVVENGKGQVLGSLGSRLSSLTSKHSR